jgi:integrase
MPRDGTGTRATSAGAKPKYCYRRAGTRNWYYEININGVRESGSTGTPDPDEAAAFVAVRRQALKAEVDKRTPNAVVRAVTGEKRALKVEEKTWGEALQQFHEDCVVGTDDERNALRRAAMLLQRMGNKPFHEVTHGDLYEYRMKRLKDLAPQTGEPISPLTANRDLAHARQVFNHMNELGVRMPPNLPTWSKLIDNEAEQRAARTRHLSTDEEVRLFAAIRKVAPHLEGFIEFMLLCGQRKAAAVFLTWDAIDWQELCFTVLLKGKGKKKKPHTVALTPRMVEIIKAQPKIEGKSNPEGRVFTYVCKRSRFGDGGHGFIRKKGERYPLTIAGWKKDWKAILTEAKIEDFRVHDIRHTNATRVVRATRSLPWAQQVLGHSQISTTMRYVHADLTDQRQALEEMEAARTRSLSQHREDHRPPLRLVK